MPQMGLEVTEATVLEVLAAVGDKVAEDTPIIEVETDKATTEIVAARAGFVLTVEVEPGQVGAVGARVARLGDRADETIAEPSRDRSRSTGADAVSPEPEIPPGETGDAGRLRAAPVARRAAARLGVAIEAVTGTGPRGRITLRDVENAAANPARAASSPDTVVEPLNGLRRVIARRMIASQLIPQYALERDIDASHLLAQKDASAAAASSGTLPGINDLLMQAVAEMVARHPALAGSFVEGPEPAVRRHARVAVGLAVATDRGLVVPVIENVDVIGLREIAAHRQRLVASARAGTLSLPQMSGGTITLSNLAGFGVDRFVAMLNPGESAIVAVGRITDRVVALGRGVTVRPMVTLTMTLDHRTVDGAVGGAALGELATLLEGAMAWRP